MALRKLSLILAFSAAVTCGMVAQTKPAYAQSPVTVQDTISPQENLRLEILSDLRQKARAQGISESVIRQALHDDLRPRPSVVRQDKNQAEFRPETLEEYQRKRINSTNIQKGERYLHQYRDIFDAAEARYGVPREVIAATWAIETNLGGYIGNTSVIENLFTLIVDGRRRGMMTDQLMAALKIIDSGAVRYEDFIGSFAGAFGQSQFMPLSYQTYAVDGNGNGTKDLYNEVADVIFSIANYHARHGWRTGERASREVKLPPGAKAHFERAATNRTQKTLQEWRNLGLTQPDDRPIPVVAGMTARLVLPDPNGVGGSAYLAYHNHEVLLRYNMAHKYALTTQAFADIYKP